MKPLAVPSPGNFISPRGFSIQFEQPDDRARVLQVIGDEAIAHDSTSASLSSLCGTSSRISSGLLRVDRDDARARCGQIGAEPEDRSVVVEKVILRIELVQELDDFRVRRAQILIEDAVPRIAALRDIDDEISAVIRDLRLHEPVLVIGPLINEHVLRLRRAEFVEVDLVKIIRRLELVGGRFVITTVEEAVPLLVPGRA